MKKTRLTVAQATIEFLKNQFLRQLIRRKKPNVASSNGNKHNKTFDKYFGLIAIT